MRVGDPVTWQFGEGDWTRRYGVVEAMYKGSEFCDVRCVVSDEVEQVPVASCEPFDPSEFD